MDTPSKESFETRAVVFHSKSDNLGVTYDRTKCSSGRGCKYEFRDCEFSYSGTDGMVSFVPTGDDTIPATDVGELIDTIKKDDILITGSIDEM